MPKPCATKSCRGKAHNDERFCGKCRVSLLARMKSDGYLTDVTSINQQMVANRGTSYRSRGADAKHMERTEFRPQVFHSQYHGGVYQSKGGK